MTRTVLLSSLDDSIQWKIEYRNIIKGVSLTKKRIMLIPDIFEQMPDYLPRRGILHIGAHQLEEEPLYHACGVPDENILWIEANRDVIPYDRKNVIEAVISNLDNVEVIFKITNNGQSSSIFSLKTHLQEHPWVYETGRRPLRTITLNTLFENRHIAYDAFDFINLDIQGAELLALQGATRILPYIRSIYTEVNERELYEGCALIGEMDTFLATWGFARVLTRMTQHGWGDAFYIRSTPTRAI